MRTKEEHYEALPDDFDVEAPVAEDPDEEETAQRIARCEEVIRKKYHHPLAMQIWDMWKDGTGVIDIAGHFGVSYAAVSTVIQNIKKVLRTEFPEEVYRVYGEKSLRKVA
jgi:hypothetical protein